MRLHSRFSTQLWFQASFCEHECAHVLSNEELKSIGFRGRGVSQTFLSPLPSAIWVLLADLLLLPGSGGQSGALESSWRRSRRPPPSAQRGSGQLRGLLMGRGGPAWGWLWPELALTLRSKRTLISTQRTEHREAMASLPLPPTTGPFPAKHTSSFSPLPETLITCGSAGLWGYDKLIM